MAGLKKALFNEEILTELSWVMSAIDTICEREGIETYQTTLIKYRVQPEEERAIDQFLFLHWRTLEAMSLVAIEAGVAIRFEEMTGLTWTLSRVVLEKLVELWKQERKIDLEASSSADE